MIQTLRTIYAALPHPLLSNSITLVLLSAGVVGAWETWKYRSRKVWDEDTLILRAITEQETLRLPRIAKKTRHTSLFICAVALAFGMIFGYGFGRTIAGGDANLVTYRDNGTVIQTYHDHCSDWQQYQQDKKP
jgi:hypothetical protein